MLLPQLLDGPRTPTEINDLNTQRREANPSVPLVQIKYKITQKFNFITQKYYTKFYILIAMFIHSQVTPVNVSPTDIPDLSQFYIPSNRVPLVILRQGMEIQRFYAKVIIL